MKGFQSMTKISLTSHIHMDDCQIIQCSTNVGINETKGPLLLFLDQALSSHEMLEVQGFKAGTHAGGL